MLNLEYVLILGSVVIISCFMWLSFAMNSSSTIPEPHPADMGRSPSRRNRRSRKVKQTLPDSNPSAPQQRQSASVRHRRSRLVEDDDTVDMRVDGPLLPEPEENMDIDDVQCSGNQNTKSQNQKEKRESKRRKENNLEPALVANLKKVNTLEII